MCRIPVIFPVLAVFGVGLASSIGQDSLEIRELRELRTMIEQQSKQIESLNQQVARLHQAIEGQKGSAGAPVAAPIPPATEAPAEIPKAEAVDPGPRHVVAKGETLTSIAKQYNIPLAELQKVNKIENDRKLQIGQTLKIPTKTSEASAEKKETP